MPTYGRSVIATTGREAQVLVNYEHVQWAVGGVTIDWGTVAAATTATTFPDGVVVRVGQKALRLGTVLTRITASGRFGPFDADATDGRETLTLGACFVLNQTTMEMEEGAATDHPGVFDGGTAWLARLAIGGAGQPTEAAFLAAFPRIALER